METTINVLPFEPESAESLRSRFVDSIAVPFNPLEALATGVVPASSRKHIFDFQDGWRLQVTMTDFEAANRASKTKFPIRHKKLIHVSGCKYRSARPSIAEEKREVLERFRLISGIQSEPIIDLRTNISYQLMFKPVEEPKDGKRVDTEDSQVSSDVD